MPRQSKTCRNGCNILVIIRGIFLKAMPFGVALENLLPLVALTVVSLLFAGWFFKKKLD